MSFIPKVAGGLVGGALGTLAGGPIGGLAGGAIGRSIFGGGKKDKPHPRANDPYYKPQTDANGNPISTGGYRSGRGSSSLSV